MHSSLGMCGLGTAVHTIYFLHLLMLDMLWQGSVPNKWTVATPSCMHVICTVVSCPAIQAELAEWATHPVISSTVKEASTSQFCRWNNPFKRPVVERLKTAFLFFENCGYMLILCLWCIAWSLSRSVSAIRFTATWSRTFVAHGRVVVSAILFWSLSPKYSCTQEGPFHDVHLSSQSLSL